MGTLTIDNGQIKSIYAIAAKIGILDRSTHDDALHDMVLGLTGKTSIKALTHAEALAVLTELRHRSSPNAAPAPTPPRKKQARKYTELPGGMTAAQQKMVWYLMYQLDKFDSAPAGVQLRDRLCGIIQRQFKVTAFATQPFRFLNAEQGGALIEGLKAMTERAELDYLHRPQQGGQANG